MKKIFSPALVALLAFVLGIPTFVYAQQKPQTIPPVGSTSGSRSTGGPAAPTRRSPRENPGNPVALVERDFDEALNVIQEQYVEGKGLDYNALFKSSIIGMLRSLDPHSNYYDREEFEELKTDQRSEYFGIGASILNYTLGDELDTFITATFENSPAARAGLRFGDRIVEVDGVMLKPGVGYIDMTRGFNYSTTEELEDALEHLHAKGMTSLVLDLRNNPGGFLDQAIHVAEVFLPADQLILTQKGRNGLKDNTYKSHNASPDRTPLVILVNSYTASASEIVAGAMQDHDRALIVGNTSFGKGLVQSIIPLEYGAGLTLTSAKYFTPSGRLIQRDYSNGGFYDYYTHGGLNRLDQKDEVKPQGPEKKTDTGRAVYGGGGIQPDESVNARTVSVAQRRLLNPIFAFSRDLVNGRIRGFESYQVQREINFSHDLQPSDFPMTDALFKSFKEFVANDPNFRSTAPLLDHNRSFIQLQMRTNVVTAAYGRVTADRVYITADDPQVAKAVDVLPRARNLAMSAMQKRTQP